MSGSPKKASKKPRKKAIEPPLTLKSRQILLSKDRKELYLTWLSNQNRHLLSEVLEAPRLLPISAENSDLSAIDAAFESLQEVKKGQDTSCPESSDLTVLSTAPSLPWPLTAPEGFGPRQLCHK